MPVIELRPPTAEEYAGLRQSVGWKLPPTAEVHRALAATHVSAVAMGASGPIGLGRVVGDGAFYNFVVDLIVSPEAQSRGIGRLLLSALEDQVAQRSVTGILQLVADQGAAPFYERCGYVRTDDNLLIKRLS